MPELVKYDIIDEILISHGKKDTMFEYNHEKVKHLEHYGEMNKTYGLTLRFLTGSLSSNNYVMIMDDDIIPYEKTIKELVKNIKEDDERIYGLYGRDLDKNKEYIKVNVFGQVPIVLTRCLITTKEMCQYFMDNFRDFETDRIKKSKPYWNGEDILFSMLSIKKYNKLPVAIDLEHYNMITNYLSLNSISFGADHDEYRKQLTKDFSKNIKEFPPSKIVNSKTQVSYFSENSLVIDIFYTILVLVIIIIAIRINVK
tara:strand:+ start:481 stop:1248 length:768 start_codon:yes stop_codon:yes gene_type:complete